MIEQRKVLFVVYRTEWWGCFDSLCRQECLEENTFVYVMPIPYYERNLDTTEMDFLKKHFCPEQLENELPEGARLVDYQSFLMEDGFDCIYIHNPYDNTYSVDSVEEKYYSWNLKLYTQRLIYVPHLLCIQKIPEELVNRPLYEYVDAVYLPTEEAKYSLEVEIDNKVEIVPSGIPEYLGKLEQQIQKEYQDGTEWNGGKAETNRRKKLLCCLSYDNLYYGTEKLLQKLRDVFEYLKSRRDVLLIFRPDEEIRGRFAWLDGPIRKKYVELITYFQKNRVGVYDESTDLYRTVVEADGVLSFGHAVDDLFLVQGKYVLKLNKAARPIPSEETRCIPMLWAATAVEEEDRIEAWFIPVGTKFVCRMVIEKVTNYEERVQAKEKKREKKQVVKKGGSQIEVVAEVPDSIVERMNYANITKIGNCLYLSPDISKAIWKYELNTRCFYKEHLPKAVERNMVSTVPFEKYLYMIPRKYPGIVKYDIETGKIKILDDWLEKLESCVLSEYSDEPYFFGAVQQEENMLYMASSKCDVWMEFDMRQDTWKMKSMNLPKKRFVGMVKRDEWVWLFPLCEDEVILWNCITNKSQVIYKEKGKNVSVSLYGFGLDLEESIIAFPGEAENLLSIPTDLEKEEEISEVAGKIPCRKKDYLSEYQSQSKTGYHFVQKLKNGQVLAYEYYDGAFVLFDKELRVVQKVYCRLKLETVKQQYNNAWKNLQCRNEFSGILNETYSFPAMLDFFLEQTLDDRNKIRKNCRKKINL